MKVFLKFALSAMLLTLVHVQQGIPKEPNRPRILGIVSVGVYVSNMQASRVFYDRLSALTSTCDWCQKRPPPSVMLPSGQAINLTLIPSGTTTPTDLISEIFLGIDDERAMKAYLKAAGVRFD